MDPGESVVVDLALPVSRCTLVDAAGRRVVEPGRFALRVGRSSRRTDQLTAELTVA